MSPINKLRTAARQWNYDSVTGEFSSTNGSLRVRNNEGYDTMLEIRVQGRTKRIKAKRLAFYLFYGYCPMNYSIEFKDGDNRNFRAENFHLVNVNDL